jgi:lipopolysaccharide export system permease protein
MRFQFAVGAFIGGRPRRYDRLCRAQAARPDPNATAWILAKISLFRVPQLTERIMPFTVLVGAMSCYLTLPGASSWPRPRAGVSAWQFVAPAMIAAFVFGAAATTPTTLSLRSCMSAPAARSRDAGRTSSSAVHENTSGFGWQRSAEGSHHHANRAASRDRSSGNVSGYTDSTGHFHQRIEAKPRSSRRATGGSRTRIYPSGSRPAVEEPYRLATTLTPEQRESFATPETVPFLATPSCTELADRAGLGRGLPPQYQQLLARPFLLPPCDARGLGQPAPLRRRQKMVLSAFRRVPAFVLSKITEDMSKSNSSRRSWRRGFQCWSEV